MFLDQQDPEPVFSKLDPGFGPVKNGTGSSTLASWLLKIVLLIWNTLENGSIDIYIYIFKVGPTRYIGLKIRFKSSPPPSNVYIY